MLSPQGSEHEGCLLSLRLCLQVVRAVLAQGLTISCDAKELGGVGHSCQQLVSANSSYRASLPVL